MHQDFIDRVCAVLGAEGLKRLAIALRSSSDRFKGAAQNRTRATAIIELLDVVRDRGGDLGRELPGRWYGDVANQAHAPLRERFARLLGAERTSLQTAFALDMHKTSVRKVWQARQLTPRITAEFEAMAELLELIEARWGRDAWPARWHEQAPPQARRTPAPMVITGQDFGNRIGEVLECTRPVQRFAAALGIDPEYLKRIIRGELDKRGRPLIAQRHHLATLELIETLVAEGVPEDRWPERWRSPVGAAHATDERGVRSQESDGIRSADVSAAA